jgi:WS/DGAT/MGAT family acyltransferase
VAILGKVHHAAIDGVSGAEILGALFSPHPETPPPSAPRRGAEPAGSPEPRPGSWELLKETGKHWLGAPRAVPDAVGRVVQAVAGAGAAWALHRVQPPPMPWTAPHTILNDPITLERSWDGVVLPLDRLKKIKNLLETTLNDVVLAVCAGALRRWLLERGALPDEPLVAMVPVSVRGEETGSAPAAGNQVSAMLVSLATDEERPVKRLRRIHEGARASKIYLQALGARNLTDTSRFIPFSLAGLATRLYTGLHLAERHRPVFNLVITNVPGPQVPLYVGGARLLAHLGAAPVFDGMGLILPVFSYAGTLSIGITSCRSMMPDPSRLAALLREALEELEAALG